MSLHHILSLIEGPSALHHQVTVTVHVDAASARMAGLGSCASSPGHVTWVMLTARSSARPQTETFAAEKVDFSRAETAKLLKYRKFIFMQMLHVNILWVLELSFNCVFENSPSNWHFLGFDVIFFDPDFFYQDWHTWTLCNNAYYMASSLSVTWINLYWSAHCHRLAWIIRWQMTPHNTFYVVSRWSSRNRQCSWSSPVELSRVWRWRWVCSFSMLLPSSHPCPGAFIAPPLHHL